jgi:hypothetical protein
VSHVPGPWTCNQSETKKTHPALQYVRDAAGYVVAEVYGNGKGMSGDNARLVAAAPELLAALWKARKALIDWQVLGEESQEMKEINAALTKAGVE